MYGVLYSWCLYDIVWVFTLFLLKYDATILPVDGVCLIIVNSAALFLCSRHKVAIFSHHLAVLNPPPPPRLPSVAMATDMKGTVSAPPEAKLLIS